jgi:hypothetical protein
MKMRSGLSLFLLVSAIGVGCGGGGQVGLGQLEATAPRRSIVWVGPGGLDDGTAARLRHAGVDGIVIRCGLVDLSSDVPTLTKSAAPNISGSLPTGVAFYVGAITSEIKAQSAHTLWRALGPVVQEHTGSEILLDFPGLPKGVGGFLSELSNVSGLPVVPIFSVDQLSRPEALEAIQATRSCVVLVYGNLGAVRSGLSPQRENLAAQLEPIAASGARVRIGVALEPEIEPPLDANAWGDDFNTLTEPASAELGPSSNLDRSFVVRRPLTWSAKRWAPGSRVAISWTDSARLDRAFKEISQLVLPELGGWDLISLPPSDDALGIGRESLLYYLSGEGPEPKIDVSLERSGRSVRARMVNTGPFTTAVIGTGNWVEISVADGPITAEQLGEFDSLEIGFRSGSNWRRTGEGGFNGVRFFENYLGPREAIISGPVELPTERSQVILRWHLVLSTGEELTGTIR